MSVPNCQRPGCTQKTDGPRQRWCWPHFAEQKDRRRSSVAGAYQDCFRCGWPTPLAELRRSSDNSCDVCNGVMDSEAADRAWKERDRADW